MTRLRSKLPPDRELVRLVAIHGVDQAAALLGLNRQTVKNHLHGIYAEWGVRSLAHAALVVGEVLRG